MARTLFARTAALFLALIVAFQLLLFATAWMFVLRPLLDTSVQELASFITFSARTWSELPRERRQAYLEELRVNHRLAVEPAAGPLAGERSLLPYLKLLEKALTARTGAPVEVYAGDGKPVVYALDLPAGGETLRYRFTHERIGTYPGLALLGVVSSSVLLGMLAALLVARGLTRPLAQLAEATARVGRGDKFTPLPEDGPRELAALAREFNRMAVRLRELLDNRTTLLAGVSHDLRSPIARVRLALELCRENPDVKLFARMEQDLDAMNALIGDFLEFSRGVTAPPVQETDLVSLLEELAEASRQGGAIVEFTGAPACRRRLPARGLKRIVANLLDNAVRYGNGQPVQLAMQAEAQRLVIEVRDRGAGIPPQSREDVFRPFARLESSRNTVTGGSGLGLAIVRQIAEAHGWTVTLEARAGGGTVARLTLPAG